MKSQIRILVVEDEPIMQLLVSKTFQSIGCTIEIAKSGEEALTILSNNSFNLIVMDLGLPGIDGIETTRRIRKSNITIPIVALTAHAESEKKQESLDAGMNGYFVKPLTLDRAHLIVKFIQE